VNHKLLRGLLAFALLLAAPAGVGGLAVAEDAGGARSAPAAPPADPYPSPRLESFYEITLATPRELRRIDADNASILGVRIGDALGHMKRTLGKPHGKRVEKIDGKVHHTVYSFENLEVRVDANGRISRIRVMASGAKIMKNALETLMTDFSERRMRTVLGWNYHRKLKRVYVWPISRSRFRQDRDRERLLTHVQQYYGLQSVEEAEKRIIRAWDTVYIYPERGIRLHVYSNIPVSGRFKADFVLLKPPAPGPPEAGATGPPSR